MRQQALTGKQRRQLGQLVQSEMRRRHTDEFTALREGLRSEGVSYTSARNRALKLVCANHRDEASKLRAEIRAKMTPEGRIFHGPKERPSLSKVRKTIDPMDAQILHGRGLKVPEIAAYDGCTQIAVVRELAPGLAKEASRYAAWYEGRRMSPSDIAQVIGCEEKMVERVLAEAA